ITPSTYFLLGTSCSSSASWEREILFVPIFISPDKVPPLLSNLLFKFFVSVINFESVYLLLLVLDLLLIDDPNILTLIINIYFNIFKHFLVLLIHLKYHKSHSHYLIYIKHRYSSVRDRKSTRLNSSHQII